VPATATVRDEILRALKLLRVDDQHVLELRALGVPQRYGRSRTVAGWFDDMEKLAAAAAELDARKPAGIYITLNPVDPALLARAHNRTSRQVPHATADKDILRRVWLPFDFDPLRPANISATDQEVAQAIGRAILVADWLRGQLGNGPDIWALSGNGAHLLYRIDLPNDEEATRLVRAFIGAVATRFTDEKVSVDRTVFNAARIWKVYGTTARKGENAPELGRVHRRAVICPAGFVL
jgi:hypothetical protein